MNKLDLTSGVTRSELYELVWSEPMTAVAKRFGVSSSYMARVCFSLSVPRPPRGYWAKLQYGKPPKKVALPELFSERDVIWKPGFPLYNVAPVVRTVLPRKIIRQGVKSAEAGNALHPIMEEAAAAFKNSNQTREAGFLKPSKRNLPDILVTEAALPGALQLANTLYLALEARGHVVILAPHSERVSRPDIEVRDKPTKQKFYDSLWSPWKHTVVYIKGTPIGLVIFELTESTLMRHVGGKYVKESDYIARGKRDHGYTWTTTHEVPTGRLCLQIYTSYYDVNWTKQWKEAKVGKFNESVASLVKSIEKSAPEAAAERERGRARGEVERIRQEHAHLKWLEEERIRKKKAAMAKSKTDLDSVLDRYERAMRVSRIFEHIESLSRGLGTERREDFDRLLLIAKKMAGEAPTIDLFMAWEPPRLGSD